MTIKYIPLFLKYEPLILRMTNEQIGDLIRKEYEYISKGVEPTFSSERQEDCHTIIWSDLREVQGAKAKKKQYDAENYKNKKKKTEE